MATVWRWELEGVDDQNGAVCLSHIHYQTDLVVGSLDEPSASDVRDAIDDRYTVGGVPLSRWRNCMSNASRLTETRVREEVMPGSGAIPAVSSQPHSLAGLLGSPGTDALPSAMCVWMAFGTGVAARSARGGTHLPPTMAASFLDGLGRWDDGTGYWTNVLALADDIPGTASTGGVGSVDLNPVVYSRTRRARGLDDWTFRVTAAVPSIEPRWLRRRES